ncbi:hypothetical protein [Pedobacter sp. AJM]|uniref:hypothetical protein n=1 Tax=Pedobacter sp. AJM TaxID=2003629 RepID=UPI000B4AE4AC|nr:hypothetical protein [Pedobacter sp. AJM]OWK68711.1 hypothetical protein CBW18_20740 [Pedobacter sp. AJM]
MNHFYKTTIAFSFCLLGWNTFEANAQSQTINGNLNIGEGFQSSLGYAPGIFMLGNSDDFFIRRYNTAPNQSEFRFAIGDDFAAEDRFAIGVNYANTTWYDRMVVQGDGKVGIGTSTPTAQLQVNGGALVLGTNAITTNTDGHLSIGNINEDSNPVNGAGWQNSTTFLLNGKDFTSIGFHDSGQRVDYIRAGQGTIQMGYDAGWGRANIGMPLGIWNAQGNVGIGTLTPKEALSVNGKIRAQEVKVETSNWPDFVFAPQYPLMPLHDLESYISKNGHLPETPAAKEIDANGLSLGEMVKLQQQKIEELSLYIIQQNKRLNEQELRTMQQLKLNEALSENILLLKKEIRKIR